MPTQEERITALEQTMAEYRPVLQNMAYELTMVKGLIINQVEITRQFRQDVQGLGQAVQESRQGLQQLGQAVQELRQGLQQLGQNTHSFRQDVTDVKTRLARMEEQLATILMLLRPS